MTQFMVLAACAAWIAWQLWAIAFEGSDVNGVLLLPAIAVVIHMGHVLRQGNRRAMRLDALCLGAMFLAAIPIDVTRILAYELGEELWPTVWVELFVGVSLVLGWRLSR